jgi:hypothetical protein
MTELSDHLIATIKTATVAFLLGSYASVVESAVASSHARRVWR